MSLPAVVVDAMSSEAVPCRDKGTSSTDRAIPTAHSSALDQLKRALGSDVDAGLGDEQVAQLCMA
jgi:hypothetical protein